MFDEFGDSKGAWESNSKMDVVGDASDPVTFAIEIPGNRGEISVSLLPDGVGEEGVAVFRGKDEVEDDMGKGLRHREMVVERGLGARAGF